MVVGDGSTSDKRWGGPFCESLFQMVFDQGNEALLEWPRPKVEPVEDPLTAPQDSWSFGGLTVLGLTGEKGRLLLNECLRFKLCCPSGSHDARRIGFGAGLLVTGRSGCRWSWSSSEDASASESGVEPRMLCLSRNKEALPPGKPLKEVRFG